MTGNININHIIPVVHILQKNDRRLLNVNFNLHTITPGINVDPSMNDSDFTDDFRQQCAPQHQTYTIELAVLFNYIQSPQRLYLQCKYDNIDTTTAPLQHLHMSELLYHDEDSIDPDGQNNIDVSRMITNGCTNDFTIGGSPALQLRIREILYEFNDIFSLIVKVKAMAVPP